MTQPIEKNGGAKRDRTADLLHAIEYTNTAKTLGILGASQLPPLCIAAVKCLNHRFRAISRHIIGTLDALDSKSCSHSAPTALIPYTQPVLASQPVRRMAAGGKDVRHDSRKEGRGGSHG